MVTCYFFFIFPLFFTLLSVTLLFARPIDSHWRLEGAPCPLIPCITHVILCIVLYFYGKSVTASGSFRVSAAHILRVSEPLFRDYWKTRGRESRVSACSCSFHAIGRVSPVTQLFSRGPADRLWSRGSKSQEINQSRDPPSHKVRRVGRSKQSRDRNASKYIFTRLNMLTHWIG